MKKTLLLALICILAVLITQTAQATITWTDGPVLVGTGKYRGVHVADVNKDGIMDVIAAHENPDIAISRYAGLPIWLGQLDYQNGRWNWVLAPVGQATGINASFISPHPNAQSGPTYMTVPLTGSYIGNDLHEWTITHKRDASVAAFEEYDPYGTRLPAGTLDYVLMANEITVDNQRAAEGDTWTITQISAAQWEVSSQKFGDQAYAFVSQPYSSDDGEVAFTLKQPAGITYPGQPGWRIVFTTKLARAEVTCRGVSTSVEPENYSDLAGEVWSSVYSVCKMGNFSAAFGFLWGWPLNPRPSPSLGPNLSYSWHTPLGPETKNEVFHDVKVMDMDIDGDQDLIAASAHGLKIWQQTGPEYTYPAIFKSARSFKPTDCLSGRPRVPFTAPNFLIDKTATKENTWKITLKDKKKPPYWGVNNQRFGNQGEIVDYLFTSWDSPYGENHITLEDGISHSSFLCVESFIRWSSNNVNFSDVQEYDRSMEFNRITLGDFDNNGRTDIIAGTMDHGVRLYINRGNRIINAAFPVNSGTVMETATADINHDGLLDVVVACTEGSTEGIRIYYNRGNFQFREATIQPAIEGYYYSVSVTDFNNDNFLDVAAAKYDPNNDSIGGIDIWYGAIDDLGNYRWEQFATASVPLANANNWGDGSMSNIIVDNSSAHTEQWVVRCVRSHSDQHIAKFEVRSSIYGRHADANEDFIYTSDNGEVTFRIFPGTEDFNAQAPDTFTFVTSRGPLTPVRFNHIVASDINNDSKPDLIGATEGFGMRVWIGNGAGGWTQETSPAEQGFYNGLCADIDINRDGNADIIGANRGGGLQMYVGDGIDRYPFDEWISKPVHSGKYYGLSGGDYTNDGCLDLIAAQFDTSMHTDGISVWRGNCAGNWDPMNSPESVGSMYYAAEFGDLDNDGDLDIVASQFNEGIRVFLQIPGSIPSDPPQYIDHFSIQNGYNYWNLRLDDLNRDGKLDLVAAENTEGFSAWLGLGDGTFYHYDFGDMEGNYPGWGIDTGDIDLDGYPDVILGGHTGTGMNFWYTAPTHRANIDCFSPDGNVDICFEEHWSYLSAAGYSSFYGVNAKDLNRDGILDIIATENGHGMSTWLGLGSRIPNPRYGSFHNSTGIGSGQLRGIASGDINNDGVHDVVVASNSSGVFAWKTLLDTSGAQRMRRITFSNLGNLVGSGSYQSVFLGDFTNDSMLDVVASRRISGAESVDMWLSQRDFTPPRISRVSPNPADGFNVGETEKVVLYISEVIDPSSLNSNTFSVQKQSGVTLKGTFSVLPRNNPIRIEFIPDDGIERDINMVFIVKGGPQGLVDRAGNGLDGNNNGRIEDSPIDNYVLHMPVRDFKGPEKIMNLKADPKDGYVILTWDAPPDPDLDFIRVSWNNVGENPGPTYWTRDDVYGNPDSYSYLVPNLVNNATYWFKVVGFDTSGNRGTESDIINTKPKAMNPKVLMGGYLDTSISSANGGHLTMITVAHDPNGITNLPVISIKHQGVDTGLFMSFSDAIDANTAVYMFPSYPIPPGTPTTDVLFEFQAIDYNLNLSNVWPYMSIVSASMPNRDRPAYISRGPKITPFTKLLNDTITRPAGSPDAPQIWAAGYWDTRIFTTFGGELKVLALVMDPQGENDVASVTLMYGGQPVFDLLNNDYVTIGNIPLKKPFWGYKFQIDEPEPPNPPLPVGDFMFEIVATDHAGNVSLAWPRLWIEP